MKLFNLMLTALLSGTVFTAAFAAEAKPAKPAAAKKAVKKVRKAKKAPLTLEQQIAITTSPSVRKNLIRRVVAKKASAEKRGKDIKILMLGDSITHLWDSKAAAAARTKYFAPYKIFNLGVGGDRTQDTIQLLTNSGIPELFNPKLVTLMIGTNNSTRNDYRATVAGIKKILELISGRYPDATILLYAIFPRGKGNDNAKHLENQKVNAEIVKFCDGKKIIWVDINKEFLNSDGVLEKSVMYDLLHLAPKGFDIWGKSLQPYFEKYGR